MLRALTLALLLLAVAAPTAPALIVRYDREHGENWIEEPADPAEKNDVVVREEGGELVVTDRITPPGSRTECRGTASDTVRCPFPTGTTTVVKLGDGDDAVRLDGTGASVFGEGGDDRITGGPKGDFLRGGPGLDEVRGNEGNDRIEDLENPTDSRPDTLDGGPGVDRLEYSLEWPVGVHVDLVNGSTSLGDKLSGFEKVDGTAGDDVIIGNGDNNEIVAGRGRNTVVGGAGDDFVINSDGITDGGPGEDFLIGGGQLYGGPGDDSLQATGVAHGGEGADTLDTRQRDAEHPDGVPKPDRVLCDAFDRLIYDVLDVVTGECTTFSRAAAGIEMAPPLVRRWPRPSLTYVVRRLPTGAAPAEVRLEVRYGRRVVGRSAPTVLGHAATIRVPLRVRPNPAIGEPVAWTLRARLRRPRSPLVWRVDFPSARYPGAGAPGPPA